MTPIQRHPKLDKIVFATFGLVFVVVLGYVVFLNLFLFGFGTRKSFPEPSLDVNCNEFQYADRTPRWSADGQVIVVNPGERLLGVNLNGGEPFVIRGNTGERQYSPSLSRDGRVAYQIGFENRVSDTYERHTAIADLSGSEVEFVAQERHCSSIYPVWSPDGKRLAFITEPISSREGRWLSIVDAVGPTARHSIPPGFQKFSNKPVWSNNGKHIAFLESDGAGNRFPDDSRIRISTISRDGTDVRVLAETWVASREPPGRNALRRKIVSVPARTLVPSLAPLLSLPAWSKDDDGLYFVMGEQLPDGSWESSLYSVGSDGANERMIASLGDFMVSEVKLSPDGSMLLLDGSHVVNVDGTGLRGFQSDYGSPPGYASWSPDGSRIAVLRDTRFLEPKTATWVDGWELYTIAPDDSGFRTLFRLPDGKR